MKFFMLFCQTQKPRDCQQRTAMKSVTTLLLIVVSVTVQSISARYKSCPVSWTTHIDSNYCYRVGNKLTTKWKEARKACLSMGGDLVKITSAKENTYVGLLARTYSTSNSNIMWLGLVRDAQNQFTWVDGNALSGQFSNWNKGEPNNHQGQAEDCAMLYLSNMKWNDGLCNHSIAMSYVCQRPMEECCIPR